MSLEPISTAEAAQRLGVTSTTIRRMIASGRLQAVMEPRPQGARFRVLWNNGGGERLAASEPAAAVSAEPAKSPRHFLEELTHLRQRVETAAQHRNQAWQDLEDDESGVGEFSGADCALQGFASGTIPASAKDRRPLWRRWWPAGH